MILRRDHCYWCGTETFSAHKVGPCCPQLATVDHIRSKPECVSAKEYNDIDNKVNACFGCNQRRSLDWCRRRDAGLVHPTAWSLKQAEKERRREARKRARKERREIAKHCPPVQLWKAPATDIFAPPSWEAFG